MSLHTVNSTLGLETKLCTGSLSHSGDMEVFAQAGRSYKATHLCRAWPAGCLQQGWSPGPERGREGATSPPDGENALACTRLRLKKAKKKKKKKKAPQPFSPRPSWGAGQVTKGVAKRRAAQEAARPHKAAALWSTAGCTQGEKSPSEAQTGRFSIKIETHQEVRQGYSKLAALG